jgi:hypothetical protein
MLFLRMKNICLSFLLSFALLQTSAQVPVSKEPRHHVVFSNDKIRVLNVLLPPGDTTFYHVHTTPSVFISLSTTKTGSQLINEQASNGSSVQGTIVFENLSAPHTRTHRVWNADTATFHVVDVELLSDRQGNQQPPLIIPHVQLLTDTPWVRVYKITLTKAEKILISDQKRSFILIAINNTAAVISQNHVPVKDRIKEGNFFWLNPGDTLSIENQQTGAALFALLEIK